MSAKKTTYEYGKGNTFIKKDGTVGTVTQLPPNIPEPGDILFYKKRDWKKRRLNEMNQWKFVCVETQGQEKGKWKVQGLHKDVGDFNWFEPHSLMRSSEVTNDLITKTQYPVKEDTIVKQNKKPISTTKPEGDTRKKVRELLEEGMRQSDIARELGLTQATYLNMPNALRMKFHCLESIPSLTTMKLLSIWAFLWKNLETYQNKTQSMQLFV